MPKKKPARDAYLVAIGARIRAARKREGITIQQAADRAGVARVTWTKWESGERWPDPRDVSYALDLPDPFEWWPSPRGNQ